MKTVKKNKAPSIVELQEILSSLSLSDVGMYLRDVPFSNDLGMINFHPSKRTHWVAYINQKYFNLYGCSLPKIYQSLI